MAGETDSQLVNSVYLDNLSMELYNGRLDKTPGAIALRHRWYGTGTPELVFVERKTHRESWAGEVSVKVGGWPTWIDATSKLPATPTLPPHCILTPARSVSSSRRPRCRP